MKSSESSPASIQPRDWPRTASSPQPAHLGADMNRPSGHNGYLGLEPWDLDQLYPPQVNGYPEVTYGYVSNGGYGRVLRLSLDDIVGQAREQEREQLRRLLLAFNFISLAQDIYLMSQMDSDQFIQIAVIANLNEIKELTSDTDLVTEVLREIPKFQVDAEGVKVRLYNMRELGSGTFGDVFKVTSNLTGRVYALKREERISEDSKPRRREEVKALSQCNHENIVKYHGNFIDGNVIKIIMEYCPGGDLAKQIDEQRKLRKYIDHEVMLEWVLDLASGLDYLKQKKILHRDLKPANIFISHTEGTRRRLKIGDFGLARCMNRSSEMGTSKLGTPSYTAPEVLLGQDYCHEADLFSFGCVLYEMTTLERAFPGRNPFLVYEKIKTLQYDKKILESNTEYSYFCTQLVPRFLLKEPKDRMNGKQLLDWLGFIIRQNFSIFRYRHD